MKVYIGLGSNIDAEKNMRTASRMLREKWPMIEFSRMYESAPMHIEDQPVFLNAVATIDTNESADDIRSQLNIIEDTLDKNIEERFGPRTIDLDILLYGDQNIETESLTIPHPRMYDRRFVLEPLSELTDDEGVKIALQNVQDQSCTVSSLVL